MKQLFFLFGLSALSLNTFAQQNDQAQHISDKYGRSVFANNHTLRPEKRADIGVNSKLQAQFPSWYITTDPWTGGFKDLNGKPVAVAGSSLLDKAINLMKNQLSVVNIRAKDWKLEHQFTNNKGFTYLYFFQEIDGKKVAFAKMHFRFTPDGKIARINMKGYGNPDESLVPIITEGTALAKASEELDGAIITNQSLASNLEWFPIPSTKGYSLHPAYKFNLKGRSQESGSIPLNISGYVDAITGDLLYRDNETKDAIDLKVVGSVYTDGFLNSAKVVGLPYITATLGTATTLLADDTGFFSTTSFTLPSTATISLEGPWSKTRTATDGYITPSFSKSITALGSTDSFATSTLATSRHLNAYYHVNTIHDFMKSIYGSSFTGMDYSLRTNIDITGECNAFFTRDSGTSINFFPPSASCPSYSEIKDIVYHEYGHAIASSMYPGGMRNGALNEGQADVWGMSITKDSVLARGSRWTPGSFIRRYDLAPKVFPFNLVGQVHADGEIIAGAWWDYGKNVGNIDSMSNLFAQCLLNEKPDGPNGTEGEVYFEMLMAALINDDDDAVLSNGTPHFNEIVSAFARHGIFLLQDIDFDHNELAHQPAGKAIDVNVRLTMSNPTFFQGLDLVYKLRSTGVWDTLAMTDAGGFNYTAQIPAQPESEIVDYYFSVSDLLNNQGVYFPANYYPSAILSANKVTLNFQFAVGVSRMRTVDFESTLDTGWQIGVTTVDKASEGKWIQAKPTATYSSGNIVQMGFDHTTGTGKCLVTGNAWDSNPYTQSVKNGLTSVRTPFYDISSYTQPIVEYYRWYSNDRGRHPKKEIWRVQISSGSEIFVREVENTNQSDHQWRRRIFNVKEYYPTADKMQLRFLASESIPGGSSNNGLVEAGIDDFVIYEGKEGVVSSIDEKKQELAQIYPNPAVDVLNVVLPSASFDNIDISFYDITGKIVSTVPITKGATRYSIDTKSMVTGQYLLVIKMDKTIQTQKVTITAQ